jgi:transcription-repair coupling factor (superfamily II helicase)
MKHPPIDPARIIQLIQSGKGYRLSGPEKLWVEAKLPTDGAKVRRLREIFAELETRTSGRAVVY